ncbi:MULTISPECIES: AAA family ATPase [unclassified Paenibacillus]|uniref:AAA family ATPase n=1 Tax=unclassified Paenibacillus TaxID=185978 RepID=UPI000FE23831|nr:MULTISPECIES: AAA family ATPase [unclassified Paenibacillus]MCM3172909.1 AAA family ATPase [Paenibacillus sp. MER 99-2]
MKKLIVVNGSMGIGKTSTCKYLYKSLDRSVWLDGDWCWMMNPWTVNKDTIEMVENNITYLLNSYLENPLFNYVIFSWVLHREDILNDLLERLHTSEYKLYKITLTCSEESLRDRMHSDMRSLEQINNSINRLQLYQRMQSNKIDTSDLGIEETVEKIIRIIS